MRSGPAALRAFLAPFDVAGQRPSAAPAGLRGSEPPTSEAGAGGVALGGDDLGAADGHGVEGADGPHPVAVAGEPGRPGRGRVRLDQHGEVLAPPEAEGTGRGGVEGEPGRRDGGGRVLAGPQQAGQQLHDDLRLGVAAHGPDQVRQRAVGAW